MSPLLAASFPEGVRIHLGGILDESFDYQHLARLMQGHTVLDLEHIRRVTSFGVAQWQAVLSDTPATLTFIRCPPCMMTQFNIIRQFDCGGLLVSVYLPYLCSHCGTEQRVLYDRRDKLVFSPGDIPQTIGCPQCHRQAEFDDVPEVYFEYLLSAPPVLSNPELDRLIGAP